jgi:hypothetical protein
VDVKVQQELLRHADIRTTLNVYTQAVCEQKRTAHSSVVRMLLPGKEGEKSGKFMFGCQRHNRKRTCKRLS